MSRFGGSRFRFRAGFLKLFLGAALLAALFLFVHPRRLWAAVASADGRLVFLALLASCGAVVLLEAWRFQQAFFDWNLSFAEACRLTLAGQFVGTFTPGALGAEGYKVYALKRPDEGVTRPLVRLALLRLLGALAVVSLAGGACLVAPQGIQTLLQGLSAPEVSPWGWAVVGLAAAILGALAFRLGAGLRRAVSEVAPRLLAKLFGTSLGVALLRGLSLALLVRGFGQTAPFGGLLVVVALAVLSGVVPISPAGLGVQEGVLAGGLVLLGLPAATAVAVSLVSRGFLWLFAALGGLALAFRPR